MRRPAWGLALLLLACDPELEPCHLGPWKPEREPADVHVLTWNIGNADTDDPHYALRLRDRPYEDFVGAQIRAMAPDVVALQEVLAPTACAAFEETDPRKTCAGVTATEPPVRRLLGPDYTIVCDANRHVECLGVRTGFGRIRGVEPGGFALSGAATEPLPGVTCDYLAGECVGDGPACDAEASVSTVIVESDALTFRVIHAHPTAIGNACRQRELQQVFERVDRMPTLLLGDWNFDPGASANVAEAAIWSQHVGFDKRFREHGERERNCLRVPTSAHGPNAIDLVASDLGSGVCRVHDVPRLDEGFDFGTLGAGPDYSARIDHFAVECGLRLVR